MGFPYRIADTFKIIDTNRNRMRIQFILAASESMKVGIEGLVDKIEDNEKFIPITAYINDLERFDIHDLMDREEAASMSMELID